jgi:drug/metabolite transporter (DMT)-like permease
MSPFFIGNAFLFSSIILGAGSQVIFKFIFNKSGPPRFSSSLWDQVSSGWMIFNLSLGVLMLAAGFLFWIASLTKLNLSYAYPVACGSALLVVAMSAFFLGEAVTYRTWIGAVLVAAGTGLLVSAQ